MITIEEWDEFVQSYDNYDKHLPHKGEFGKYFPFIDRIQNEIEEKHKISIGAYCILGSYAGRGCFIVNEQLRDEKWVPCDGPIQLYADLLNRALDEVSGFNNNVCFRWSNLNEEGYEYLKRLVGKKIMVPQFWSTSYNKVPASDQFFEIHTEKKSKGRYISRIVDKPSEQEILFKSHTVFKLFDFDSDTIYFEEITGEEYDLSLCNYFWEKNSYTKRAFEKLFPEEKIKDNRQRFFFDE